MSKFTGVWAIFEYLDETTDTIEQVREQGVQPTVLMPCPRHEIDHALGEPGTLVPWIALVFGALGCLIGFSLPAWTASDWVLPVSGKPIVAIPPFTIIGFELTILLTSISTLLGLFLLGFIDTCRFPIPKAAKKYRRFQRDRFGVVVRCDSSRIDEFESIMKKNGAEEVHVEKE
jgi:molybdopterin-containing oxidoreductase family membrane subunit|tara:strand:+ start:146 stop:667 length:522 start_codon:yes stop_codon:yes gene_type:complete